MSAESGRVPPGAHLHAMPRVRLLLLKAWAEDLGNGVTEWRASVRVIDALPPSGLHVRAFRNWPALATWLQMWCEQVFAEDEPGAQR